MRGCGGDSRQSSEEVVGAKSREGQSLQKGRGMIDKRRANAQSREGKHVCRAEGAEGRRQGL